MVSSVTKKEQGLEFVGFRVEPQLDEELTDLAWENRMNKSELIREICRYGVENFDDVLDEDSDDNRTDDDE